MEAVEVYKINNITFILHPSKTVIQTSFQTFLLMPTRHVYNKKMAILREEIRKGNMKSMAEVVNYCNLQPGRRGQMLGIEMVNTTIERHNV